MATPQIIKERSYKIVHTMRLKNQRENRLLHNRLYSKQGIHAACLSEMDAVSKEQERIKRELAMVRKTITTTWGILPTRGGSPDQKDRSRVPKELDMEYIMRGVRGKEGRKKRGRRRPERPVPLEDRHQVVATSPTEVQKEHSIENEQNVEVQVETDAGAEDDKKNISEVTLPPLVEHVEGIAPKDNQEDDELTTDNNLIESTDPRDNDEGIHLPEISPAKAGGEKGNLKTPVKTDKQRPKAPRRPKLTPIDENGLEVAGQDHSTVKIPVEELQENDDTVSEAASFSSSKKSKKTKKKKDGETAGFNSNQYNPDGSIRTMHIMPDIGLRMTEAKKARYIRHKQQPASEKELSINDMLADIRQNKRLNFSVRTF